MPTACSASIFSTANDLSEHVGVWTCRRDSIYFRRRHKGGLVMPGGNRMEFALAVAMIAGAVISGEEARAQSEAPVNDAPNPYRTMEGWGQLPDGRKWGSTSAVDID